MESERKRFEALKKQKWFSSLQKFLQQLEEEHTLGPERVKLVKQKFPEVSDEDILFLLFYGWR